MRDVLKIVKHSPKTSPKADTHTHHQQHFFFSSAFFCVSCAFSGCVQLSWCVHTYFYSKQLFRLDDLTSSDGWSFFFFFCWLFNLPASALVVVHAGFVCARSAGEVRKCQFDTFNDKNAFRAGLRLLAAFSHDTFFVCRFNVYIEYNKLSLFVVSIFP